MFPSAYFAPSYFTPSYFQRPTGVFIDQSIPSAMTGFVSDLSNEPDADDAKIEAM